MAAGRKANNSMLVLPALGASAACGLMVTLDTDGRRNDAMFAGYALPPESPGVE